MATAGLLMPQLPGDMLKGTVSPNCAIPLERGRPLMRQRAGSTILKCNGESGNSTLLQYSLTVYSPTSNGPSRRYCNWRPFTSSL